MAITPEEQLQRIDQEIQNRIQKEKQKAQQQAQQQAGEGMKQIGNLMRSKEIVAPIEQRIDQKIAERGILDPSKDVEKMIKGGRNITSGFKEGKLGPIIKGTGQAIAGGFGIAAEPFERAGSAVSNVALATQRDVINPKFLFNEFITGLTGTKRGKPRDVIQTELSKFHGIEGRGAEMFSATAGFAAEILVPYVAIGKTLQTFGKLSKFTDKGITRAGESLVKAIEAGKSAMGANLTKAYEPFVKLAGRSDEALFRALNKLPKSVLDDVVEATGKNLEDIIINPTVGVLREAKGAVGKFRPGIFEQQAVGADIKKEGEIIKKAYSLLKKNIQDIFSQNKLGAAGNRVLKADDAFDKVSSAGKFIQGQVVDKTLRLPTKAGQVAKGIKTAGDTTTRTAMNILKRAGREAKRNIIISIKELNSYNRIVAIGTAVRRGAQVVQNAAVIGLLLKTPVGKSILRGTRD